VHQWLITCNPSYSGDRDQENHSSRTAQEKKLVSPHLNQVNKKKRYDSIHLSSQLLENINSRTVVQARKYSINTTSYLKKKTRGTGDVAPVVKQLPNKCETLSPNFVLPKNIPQV
jgi:hypothetical protein